MRFGRLARSMIRVFFARGAGSVLGIVIAVLIANRLGAGGSSDAFFLVRRVTLGLTEAVKRMVVTVSVPPIVAMLQSSRGKTARHSWIWHIAPLFAWLTSGTIVTAILAGWVVILLAPGFDAEQHRLSAELLRILVFTIPLHFVLSALSSLLYAFRRFTVPELAAVMPRLLTTVILFLFVPPWGVSALGWTILLGTVTGILLLMPSVALTLKSNASGPIASGGDGGPMDDELPSADQQKPEFRRRTLPAMIFQIYRQSSGWIDLAFASLLVAGAVTITEYGQRLAFLIPALLMNSFFTVFYTEMAHDAVEGGVERLRKSIAASLRAGMFVLIPFMLFLCVAAKPIVDLVFQHGAFDAETARQTVLVTQFFAPSVILAFAMRALALGAYADAESPLMRIVLAMVIAGLITRIPALALLPSYLGVAGIPVAIVISTLASCLVGYHILSSQWGAIFGVTEFLALGKIASAAILSWLAMVGIGELVDIQSYVGQISTVAIQAFVGALVYALAALALRVEETRRLWARLRSRRAFKTG